MLSLSPGDWNPFVGSPCGDVFGPGETGEVTEGSGIGIIGGLIGGGENISPGVPI